MCREKILEYYIAEMKNTYMDVRSKIRWDYKEMCDKEEAAYKRTPEYRKAKNKAYWNRSKEVIGREALDEQLARLGYWTPRQNLPSKSSHITYSKNATDTLSYETAEGFVPSISEEEYFAKNILKLTTSISHPFWQAMSKEITYNKRDPVQTEEFIMKAGNRISDKIDDLFLKDLLTINCLYEMRPLRGEFKSLSNRVPIVSNGCRVITSAYNDKELATFLIDIKEYPEHIKMLGLKEGDSFSLPDVIKIFRIEEIWG